MSEPRLKMEIARLCQRRRPAASDLIFAPLPRLAAAIPINRSRELGLPAVS